MMWFDYLASGLNVYTTGGGTATVLNVLLAPLLLLLLLMLPGADAADATDAADAVDVGRLPVKAVLVVVLWCAIAAEWDTDAAVSVTAAAAPVETPASDEWTLLLLLLFPLPLARLLL